MFEKGIYLNGEKLERYIQRNNEIIAENSMLKVEVEMGKKLADLQDERIAKLEAEVNKLQNQLLRTQHSERLAWATAEQYKRTPNALHINVRG